ncbi:MAG: methylamine utilization protein [Burkholderiales bacterium]
MMFLSRQFAALILALTSVATIAQTPAFDITATVTDQQGKPLADAVVVAVPLDGNLRLPVKPRDDTVDQVDKQFVPKVMAIAVGTSVFFPNNDNVRHQVYSFSPAKRFELPLYAGVPAQPILFDKPGIVVLGCNIHDWMVGYIYVSESPYFAKTGANGKAKLADLPPRAYAVRVWHPQSETPEEATRRSVEASSARVVDVEWALKLKPEVRVRRAPSSDRGARY